MISSTQNKLLMDQARESLRGKWGRAIGTFVVYAAITSGVPMIPEVGWVFGILISGSMMLGLCIFSLNISRAEHAELNQLFEGFKRFGLALGAYILKTVFILLWTLLLVVPGIIAALSYSMTFFIIAENEEIGPLEAITRSKEMMRGNKWKLFCLFCRFIGWFLLCILSCGIGFLWFGPYMAVSLAGFYDDLVEETPESWIDQPRPIDFT